MSSAAAPPEPSEPGPIPLDGIAYGTQGLTALLAIHLGDAHLHAAFVRDGAALPLGELCATLRDAYRACQGAARKLPAPLRRQSGAPGDGRPEPPPPRTGVLSSRPPRGAPDPPVSLEEGGCVVLLRRVRAYVVACVFEAATPLGMARLFATRLIATLSPELPLGEAEDLPATTERDEPWAAPAESARAVKLLALVDALAPEPHVARLRVSLRAGLPPDALEQPDVLGPDAVPRIETAVEEILGLDRAALRRLL